MSFFYNYRTSSMECLSSLEALLAELTFQMTKLPQKVLGSHPVFKQSVNTLNELMIAIHSLKLTASEEDLEDDSIEFEIELKTVQTEGFAHMVTEMKTTKDSDTSTICPQCGEYFKSKWKFSKHMERHEAGEKNFHCSECEESFYIEYDLQVHQKKHDKHLMCSQCDFRCSRKFDLNRHMATHSSERPWVCSDCGRGFKDQSSLRKHLKIHSGIREHECKECGKAFFEKRDLKVHMMTHTGQRQHYCTMCTMGFLRKDYLRKHMMSAHNIDVQPEQDTVIIPIHKG